MLDLTKLIKEQYQIKMVDGEIITIKNPSQAFLMKMINLESLDEDNTEEVIKVIFELCLEILNNNTDGKKFDKAYVDEKLGFNFAKLIMEDYLNFVLNDLGE